MVSRGWVAVLALAWLTQASAEEPAAPAVIWLPVAAPTWSAPSGPFILPPWLWWWPAYRAVLVSPVSGSPPAAAPISESVTETPAPVPALAPAPAPKPAALARKPRPGKVKAAKPPPRKLCWKDNVLAPCP